MSLSRSRAEELGVAFAVEDDFRGSPDPDVPNFRAEITRNDTTIDFAGKSEEHVLEQVEQYLRGQGELGNDEPEAVDQPGQPTQDIDNLSGLTEADQKGEVTESDVHDVRGEDDEVEQPDGGGEA
jgi:hypothetical protein